MSLTFPPRPGASSPWGAIQTVTPLGPDAAVISTAAHGGICISPSALARIPEPLRRTPYSAGGWFEEDCDWAIPYLALGLHAFEPERAEDMRLAAIKTVRRWHGPSAALLGVDQAGDARDPTPDEGRREGSAG